MFERDGQWFRHLNASYAADYALLMGSGLYDALVRKNKLIPHTEIRENVSGSAHFHVTLLPQQITFISYAYEWSFDMLRDAALLTLDVGLEAIAHGMILKDATSFNVQFEQAKPVFIDTASFEKYDETKPWIAYRQFCESFLAPLLLTHYTGMDLNRLLMAYPEGIPIAICAKLLPWKSWFSLLTVLHIHLQAGVKTDNRQQEHRQGFSRQKLRNILQHLRRGIAALRIGGEKTVWSDYYSDTIKSQAYLQEKQAAFHQLLDALPAGTALDIGANRGVFSRLLAEKHWQVIAADFDPGAINDLYLDLKKVAATDVLPLVVDIIQPTPALGWSNTERASFMERSTYDLVSALALVHHLAIAKNIHFEQMAPCFHALCGKYLIIEFVEKEDEKARILLQRKETGYEWYNRSGFEAHFTLLFSLVHSMQLSNGLRTLYLWKRK